MADTPETDTPRRLSATPARQGRIGRDVFVVLVASLALALLAVFGSWVWNSGRLASVGANDDGRPAAARSTQATEPAPIANPPPQGQRP
jgi:hypothetical protein